MVKVIVEIDVDGDRDIAELYFKKFCERVLGLNGVRTSRSDSIIRVQGTKNIKDITGFSHFAVNSLSGHFIDLEEYGARVNRYELMFD